MLKLGTNALRKVLQPAPKPTLKPLIETIRRPFQSCLRSANDVDVRERDGTAAVTTTATAATEAAEVEQMMMKVTAEAAAMMMAMDI